MRKADGSTSDRACDLVELCKDAKHFNRKFEQASLNGNVAERDGAGTKLKKTLVWMSAYRSEDVAWQPYAMGGRLRGPWQRVSQVRGRKAATAARNHRLGASECDCCESSPQATKCMG